MLSNAFQNCLKLIFLLIFLMHFHIFCTFLRFLYFFYLLGTFLLLFWYRLPNAFQNCFELFVHLQLFVVFTFLVLFYSFGTILTFFWYNHSFNKFQNCLKFFLNFWNFSDNFPNFLLILYFFKIYVLFYI